MEKKEIKQKLIEWLISLAVTIVLLAAVVGFQFWLTGAVSRSLESSAVWQGNLIGDAVGGVIMLLLVHHFVKKPKDKTDQ